MVLNVIAVTGASGMLGRHSTAALAAAGFHVLECSRNAEPEGRRWDLTQWKSEQELDTVFGDADAIVHAGAAVPRAGAVPSDEAIFDANVRASFNLAQWARKRGRPVVFISGAVVYADPERTGIDEDAPLGHSQLGGFYGMSKLLAEDLLRREAANGLQLAVLRPSSIYGAGLAQEKMMSNFLRTAGAGRPIDLTPPVEDRVDLIHAADVAHAIVRVVRTGCWETFNIGSERLTSVFELAEICVRVAGRGEVRVSRAEHSSRAPNTRFGVNCARARTRLDWAPSVDLVEGVRTVLDGSVPRTVERVG